MTRTNSTLIARFLITFVLLFFISPLQLTAQWPGYKTFPLSEDNRSIKINTLFKTNKGYIYTGTTNGLYKFDGERFSKIYFENKDYNDTVSAIFQDNTQRIWVGFESGRIAHVINNKLVYFNPEEGTPQKRITTFLQDKENNIWFATAGEGLYYIRNKKIYLLNESEGMSDLNVSAIAVTKTNVVLAGTDQGINICSISGNKKTIAVIGPGQGLPDYIVTSIESAGNDLFWVGMQDKGFCLYDHLTKKIKTTAAINGWNHGQINSMIVDDNTLWIATQLHGLLKYNIRTDSISTVKETGEFLSIKNLLKDNQGNIWLTSPEWGLIRTPGETLKLFPLTDPPIFEHIHTILSDKEGNIWVNDEDNRIVKYSLKNGIYLPHKITLNGLTEKTDITSLYLDEFGNIWIGTMGKGIYILDPKTEKYRVFTENEVFKNASVLSINGRHNSIFASSLQGVMVVTVSEINKNIAVPYRFKNYNNSSTGTNYVYSIFQDSRNRIWFATDGRGLTMLDNNNFTYYNDSKKINDDHIYSITEDKRGNIWFSTASAGLYKFDGKNFTDYVEKDGLSDLTVSALKTDSAGNIIIVHQKGLDILDPATGSITYVNSNQGIGIINAEDLGAITLDTAGNVMVSTVNGILSYHHPKNSLQKPTTIIESVQLFLQDIDETEGNIFKHAENSFTFNYTGLYYSNPEQIYYQYKLEGFDSSWILTKDKSKTFPNLQPGDYTYRIQSALNKNFRNADEASYHFVIKKAFYKTYWFIGLCLFVLAILLYWYIKSREKSLKRLEYMRQEKIQFQFEVLRNQVNPHFLFNSFNTLISTIEDDPAMAVGYVEQLAEFFQNILTYRDKDVITLEDEITVLQTYFYLQQKRYGDNLKLNINLSEEAKKTSFIPPLTLQLLLENAIKHNAVSKEKILAVDLFTEDGNRLILKNNINPKITREAGEGMGLQNIINRYKLLSKEAVIVKNDGAYFSVSLPTLKQ